MLIPPSMALPCRLPEPSLPWWATRPAAVLKLCLQLLVCLTLGLRAVALFGHLRRAWMADALAGEFRRELRRRGLLMPTPVRRRG